MKDTIVYKNWSFTGNSLKSSFIGREESLQISSLGIDTLEAVVKTTDPSILQFRKNDPLDHYRDGIKSGVYHVQSIKQAGPNRYAISAISPLGLLANMEHLGGMYTGQTALEVIREICGPVPVLVKTRLQDTKIYNWLPIAKARDNLSKVLFVLGANLGTDHNGVLRVEPLWSGYASYIPAERVYIDNASVTQDDPVTSVTVLEHRYTPGTERKDLFEGATYQGQRISFDAPMHSLTAEGFAILKSGANYAVVSAGNGKLTGAEYIHTTIEVTRKVSDAPTPNDVRIPEDATLVSLVNSAAVADRLASYYACRTTINLDMTTRREKPGEVVKIVNPYDRQMVTAAISSMEEDVSNVVKSTASALVGFTPAQAGDSDYYTERVVLTGSGTYKMPAGATDCTAVLIGAGQGGASGMMGKASTPGSSSTSSVSYSRLQQVSVGTGGDGGAAGAGGTGGKVLQVSIPLDAIESVSYNCGVGGAGGAASKDRALAADSDKSAPGAAGGETTFGTYSSASGASSPTGYYDPITKETYAASGTQGVSGGKGGGFQADDSDTSLLPLNDGQAPGPDVVYKRVVYHAGANNTARSQSDKTFESEKSSLIAFADYGAGGGAAAGANGKVSTGAPTASIGKGSTVSASSATAIGGAGGLGGDAVAPAAETRLGYGGTGGNGGGGAGGSGFAGIQAIKNDLSGSPGWPKTAQIEQASSDPSRGLGSDGGRGGPGCIILYITIGVKKRTGACMDKSKRFCLDKSGRLRIV